MALTSAPQLRAASFRVWLVPARVLGAVVATFGPCGHEVVRSREHFPTPLFLTYGRRLRMVMWSIRFTEPPTNLFLNWEVAGA